MRRHVPRVPSFHFSAITALQGNVCESPAHAGCGLHAERRLWFCMDCSFHGSKGQACSIAAPQAGARQRPAATVCKTRKLAQKHCRSAGHVAPCQPTCQFEFKSLSPAAGAHKHSYSRPHSFNTYTAPYYGPQEDRQGSARRA